MSEEFVDYSTILMRIENTERALHEACQIGRAHV